MTSKKVAMLIAHRNFRDEELLEPKKVFESEGFDVGIFAKRAGKAIGMLGAEVDAEPYESLRPEDFDAVVFVGGSGAAEYFDDKKAQEIAVSACKNGKVLAAICVAPSIIANAGLLSGKRATCFPSESENLRQKGATYTGKDVEVDGRIVTASGPAAAEKFSKEIARLLKNG